MTIHISFDPTDADDVAYVENLLGQGLNPTPAAAPKKATAKAAPAPEPEPEEEPAEEGPTLEQAVERATALVSEGRSADVKGALAQFGVKRVSELEESQVAAFLEALDEESPV